MISVSSDSITLEEGLEGEYELPSNDAVEEIDLEIVTEGGAAKPEW